MGCIIDETYTAPTSGNCKSPQAYKSKISSFSLCPFNKESNLNRMQHLIFKCQYCVRTKLVDFDFIAFSDINMQSCKAQKSFEMPVEEYKTAT